MPGRRRRGDVVRVVEAEVGAGENLRGKIRVHNDRIDGDVRQIPRFVLPDRIHAIRVATDAEDMARHAGRVVVEAAQRSVTDGPIRRGDARIERDSQDGAVRQYRVAASDVHPVRRTRDAGPEIEPDPGVAIIRAGDRDALELWRVFHLVDVGTVPERLLGHVLGRGIVSDDPGVSSGRAGRGLPNPRRPRD